MKLQAETIASIDQVRTLQGPEISLQVDRDEEGVIVGNHHPLTAAGVLAHHPNKGIQQLVKRIISEGLHQSDVLESNCTLCLATAAAK